MKNQYFGDIGDYKKFTLLRSLTSSGLKCYTCWMLTPDDNSSDGKHITYLQKRKDWCHYDMDIYNLLRESVLINGVRKLSVIEDSNLIPNTWFFNDELKDSIDDRIKYFDIFYKNLIGVDFVFFDPDNGIEVSTTKKGKKNSSKYIFWAEIEKTFHFGHSVLVYQHFPRKERNQYIRSLALEFITKLEAPIVFGIRTKHAAFFLAPQASHVDEFEISLRQYSNLWKELVIITKHTIDSSEELISDKQLNLF